MGVEYVCEMYGMKFGEPIVSIISTQKVTREYIEKLFELKGDTLDLLESLYRNGRAAYIGLAVQNGIRSLYAYSNGEYHRCDSYGSTMKISNMAGFNDAKRLFNMWIKNGIIEYGGFIYDLSTGDYKIDQTNMNYTGVEFLNDLLKLWANTPVKILKVDGVYKLVSI